MKKFFMRFPSWWNCGIIRKKKGDFAMERLNVLHVARYVTEKCAPTTAMKLEKLVYYCQAWSLAWDDVPLFAENFEAWANGPVCPELFKKHQGLFEISPKFLESYSGYPFSNTQKETMDAVIKGYGDKEPHWLSENTHQETPWKNARKGVPIGERSHNIISKESMQEFYSELAEGWE